jgi:hypothetical protein
MKLGIDVSTAHKHLLIVKLARLKTTVSVEDGGVYNECPDYSQVHLVSSWDEAMLDEWLYKSTGIDYHGTFTMEEKAAA